MSEPNKHSPGQKSLELWLSRVLLSGSGLVFGLLVLCAWLAGASGLMLVTLSLCLLPLLYLLYEWLKDKLLRPYFNLLTALESINVDDYSFEIRPFFNAGVAGRVFHELTSLSTRLRQKKRLFDEKDLLVHSLIQQLDSPVMLLDQENKLHHGNQALSRWLGKDWRLMRLLPVQALGLRNVEGQWCFSDESQQHQFKIRSSVYKDTSGEHQLLLLTDISSELREMQALSWQQMVRVLSHEIKNTLTPIKSLAQTLAEFSDDPEQKEALDVIAERSQNLSEFVYHYSQMTRVYQLNKQVVDLPVMLATIETLHPDIDFVFKLDISTINVDAMLFEQVLINLITNAKQACADSAIAEKARLTCASYVSRGEVVLALTDNGGGILNEDNLFVPFYSTKTNGQGIGLLLCRNIIEQHGGRLTLSNNDAGPGATACIYLPQGHLKVKPT